MSDFTSDYYESNRQAVDRPALQFYGRLVRRSMSPGPILDFGCGTGFLLRRLQPHMPVAGLEKSPYCRTRLAAELPWVKIYDDLAELPNEAFSGVVALHVFEHITDGELSLTLARLHSSLRPDGRLLCVMPDADGRGRHLKGAGWSGFGDPTHVNLKSAQEWHVFFEGSGFQVLRCGTDGLWDFPYRQEWPLWCNYLRFAWGAALQFMSGRLLLPVGAGESVIFLLRRQS